MTTKAKCTICGQEKDIRGMRMHMTKHTPVQTNEQTSVQTTEQNSTLDSNKLNNDLATLSYSVTTKDADIALLNDSIEQKDAEFEQIKAELADAISLEHEQELVRNVFKKLTPEAYEQIGQQLGFLTDKASIEEIHDSAPAADPGVAPAAPIPTDNNEKTSKLVDANKPAADDYIFIGEKNDPGWTYYKDMGFSLKDK
jgi:hypothetical protein